MDGMVSDDSWLKQTRQLWKFWVFALLVMTSVTLLIMRFFGMIGQDTNSIAMILGGTGFAILLILVKCPSCKKRPMFKIIRLTRINTLTQTMLTFNCCPYCGYAGGSRNSVFKAEGKDAHPGPTPKS